jgi:DNA-binding transcriptional ArsR family regulator
MRPVTKRQSALRAPLNYILGTEAHVRILRVLSETENPLSISRLADRSMLAISGVSKALSSLEEAGIVEYIGAGARRPVQLRPSHPLADAVHAIFRAERSRFDKIIAELKRAARLITPPPRSAWIEGPVVSGSDRIEDALIVGILTGARELDRSLASWEDAIEDIERAQDVSVEIHGRTAADLIAATHEEREALRRALPILGAPPLEIIKSSALPKRKSTVPSRPFSHAELDARARALATAVAERIRADPGIVEQARAQIDTRMMIAAPGEQRELREWKRILRTMSLPRLRRFLTENSERANRLRQTFPFTGVIGAEEREALIAAHRSNYLPARRP